MIPTAYLVGVSTLIALVIIAVTLARLKRWSQEKAANRTVNKAKLKLARSKPRGLGSALVQAALAGHFTWDKGRRYTNPDGTLRHSPIAAAESQRNLPGNPYNLYRRTKRADA